MRSARRSSTDTLTPLPGPVRDRRVAVQANPLPRKLVGPRSRRGWRESLPMEPRAIGVARLACVAGFAYALSIHLATAGTEESRSVGLALVSVAVGFHAVPWLLRRGIGMQARVRLARIGWALVCLGGASLIVLKRSHPDLGLETLAAGYAVTIFYVPVLLDERRRHVRWFALGLVLMTAVSIHLALTNVEWFGGSGYG